MPALADQVQVDLAQRRKVPVRVVLKLRLAIHVSNFKFVVSNGPGRLWHRHLKNTLMAVRHRVAAAVGQHYGHLGGQRAQRTDGHAVGARVGAENGVRVVVLTGYDPFDLA